MQVNGQEMLRITWPLRFERPQNLVLEGPEGGPGPALAVDVQPLPGGRVSYRVDGGAPYFAVSSP